jgi:hypothetical protein
VFREAISTKNRPDTDYAKLEQVEKAIAELAQSPRDTSPITLDDRMRAACEESLVELEASLNS